MKYERSAYPYVNFNKFYDNLNEGEFVYQYNIFQKWWAINFKITFLQWTSKGMWFGMNVMNKILNLSIHFISRFIILV